MREFLWLLVPAILALLALGFLVPAEASDSRIVFLNLTFVDGEAHLNDINIVEGHFKRRKAIRLAPNHFYYVMTSVSGKTLYEGTIPDPSILRVEYVDENGHLQMRTAKQVAVDFSIRLPYHRDAHRVTIRQIGDVLSEIQRLSDTTAEVGSFEIDLRQEEDRP
jgi:hypothetical protein